MGEMVIGKPYSNHTAEMVDLEVRQLINVCYKRAFDLLSEKKDLLKALGDRLLEKEVVKQEEIVEILGPRPAHPSSDSVVGESGVGVGQSEKELKEEVVNKANVIKIRVPFPPHTHVM
eukprot:TRINITY_DN8938_c0_g1_i1.p2 TRINITY_DN8938_c0_g1~~TRINITY_DN8938_c0_g1_i1.p2  ORF type:complete len:118 (-),score=40.09 TRINITY_DN8938_c0_g1_i1:95-448(-)